MLSTTLGLHSLLKGLSLAVVALDSIHTFAGRPEYVGSMQPGSGCDAGK